MHPSRNRSPDRTRGAEAQGNALWICTMSKAKRSKQVVLPIDRMFKRGITRDRSEWTRCSGILYWPALDELRFPWSISDEPPRGRAVPCGSPGIGVNPSLRTRGIPSGPSFHGPSSPGGIRRRPEPGNGGVDRGRFCAQGTGRRAVKRFDPSQDHQRRKH